MSIKYTSDNNALDAYTNDVLLINNKTSIAKVLFVFYVLLLLGNANKLLPHQTKDFFDKDRYAQHFLGIATFFVLITMMVDDISMNEAFVYTLLGYTWFIFSTKVDLHWNLIMLILLFAVYVYEQNAKVYTDNMENDRVLTIEEKQKQKREINKTKIWMSSSLILITVLGTYFYSTKKHEQYGGGYDILTYIFK